MRATPLFAIWFITFISLSMLAHGMSIDEVSLADQLAPDQSLQETISLRIVNNTRNSFQFSLPVGAFDVRVNGKPSAAVNDSLEVPLACSDCRVNLSYSLRDAAQLASSGYTAFSRTLNLPSAPRHMLYSVALPSGDGVGSPDQEPSIVPLPSTLVTDGERIIVAWNELSPELPKRYYISYHSLERFTTWQEISREFGEWPVKLFIVFSLAAGLIIGFFIGRHVLRRHQQEALPTVPSSLLSPDEKAILKALRENGEQMSQKELGKKLAWSKSKVSAIMTNLEYKKIVQREKIGRNYRIRLLKDIDE